MSERWSAWRVALAVFALLLSGEPAAHEDTHADLVLQGQLDRRDHQTYRELPFDVPDGIARITIDFDYSGRENKTVVDLGLIGPGEFTARDGFRGWSGGNKRSFTVSAWDATPSYLPGVLPAGRWKLLLGIPNLREGGTSHYTARIHMQRDAVPDRPAAALRSGAGWYRGDLHMHSGHSDGQCVAQSGTKTPCPLFLTVQAAAQRGLDFVALTDHNTVSHLPELRALQPYFDRTLLIPGMEVTTFQGHANAFGVYAPVDFRVGSATVPDWNAVLKALEQRKVPVSINHPALPSDERCMGCGWTPDGGVDLSRVTMVEAVNGGDADTPVSGIGFWQKQLNAGHRLTGVGGSDNHDASLQEARFGASRIGAPTTVVHARELSLPAILDGLRAGQVFVDVQGTGDRLLELNARLGSQQAAMGGTLSGRAGDEIAFELRVHRVEGGRVQVLVDGEPTDLIAQPAVASDDQHYDFRWRADGGRHWLRVDVRDRAGHLALVGNPIYINF